MDNVYADVVKKFMEVVKKLRAENRIHISEDHITYDEFEKDPIRVFIHHAKDDFSLRLRFDIVDEDDVNFVRVEVSSGEYNHFDHMIHKRKFITRFRFEMDDLMKDTLMDVLVISVSAICMDRWTEYLSDPKKKNKTQLAGEDGDVNPWMY